jgi:hypothetical protein
VNAINVIAPYKHHGMWVFDDPRVGLAQEPFVAGADTMIDRVVADIPNAAHGFTLIFSGGPFPGHQHRWTGNASKAGVIGTIPQTSLWKAGYAPRCSCIFLRLRSTCMCRRGSAKPGPDPDPIPS